MKGRLSKGLMSVGTNVCVLVPGLLAAAVLAGCGGGSWGTASAVPSSPAASSTQGSISSTDAVALVSSTPIAKSSYEHWLTVEKALGGGSNPSHQALAFLITSQWVFGEAPAHKG